MDNFASPVAKLSKIIATQCDRWCYRPFVKAGNERAFGFLVGQVMKLSRGKASPQIVNDLLKKKM